MYVGDEWDVPIRRGIVVSPSVYQSSVKRWCCLDQITPLTENQKLTTENYKSEAFVTALDTDADHSPTVLSGSGPVRDPPCIIQYLKSGRSLP